MKALLFYGIINARIYIHFFGVNNSSYHDNFLYFLLIVGSFVNYMLLMNIFEI